MSDIQVDNPAVVEQAAIPSGQEPAQPAQSGDSGTPPGDTPAEEPKRNGDGGFQRRINRLTREKHEALGRLDALERENAEIRERLTRSSSPQHQASDQEPRQDQFQRYEDFVA